MPGRLKASMATKCMDQMPPPMATAAAASQPSAGRAGRRPHAGGEIQRRIGGKRGYQDR